MAKYFIDTDIYYQGKKQLPRKILLTSVVVEPDGATAHCYDENGDGYTLSVSDIFEEN